MSKVLYHTITIKVPSDQIHIGKNGNMTIVPTLTKTNSISRRLGIPSIILKKDEHILHPIIEDKGTVEDINEVKERQKKLKVIKNKLDKLPPKSKINKENFKYALSQLPKKKKEKEGFLSDWLNIKKSAFTDKRATKIRASILDHMFDIINGMFSKDEIDSFKESLDIPESVYDNILNWTYKKHEGQIEYTDFVVKVIYPFVLKGVDKNVNKLKLMFLCNDIAHDATFEKDLKDQINKYTVVRTFLSPKNTGILSELKHNKDFKDLYEDYVNTASVEGFQHPNYKTKFNYDKS